MFGIGMSELLVIVIIGLVVIGPKQLPEVARTLGKMFAQFKRTTNDLKEQVDREVRQFSEMEEVKEFKRSMEDEMNSVKSTAEDVKSQAEDYMQKQMAEGERLVSLEENAAMSGPNNGDAGMMSSDAATTPTSTDATPATASTEPPSATADSVQYSPTRTADANPMPEGELPPGKLPS